MATTTKKKKTEKTLEELVGTAMPVNLDAERAVLGTILVDNSAFFRVQPILDVEDFYRNAHQVIYRTISQMLGRGIAVDFLTIKSVLTGNEELNEAGGSAYISSLDIGIPDFSNVERYATIIANESKRRRIVTECHSGIQRAIEHEDSPDEISSAVVSALTVVSVAEDRRSKKLYDAMIESQLKADKRVSENKTTSIVTGYEEWDARHVIRPTLVVMAAPRGHGKSAAMLNVVDGIHRNDRKACTALFTLEMTEQEVSDRVTAIRSRIPHRDVRVWRWLSEEQRQRIADATESVKNEKIFVNRGLRKLHEIGVEARRLKAMHGLTAIFIDYIQLVRVDGFKPNEKEQQMSFAAESLLELAVGLDVAVIIGSQVNKDRNSRESGRLAMEDMKYAAAIGDSARVGLLFQRPWEDDKTNDELRPCAVKFQIEKNNEGGTRDYDMHFDPSLQILEEGSCSTSCRYFNGAKAAVDDEPQRALYA